MTMTLIHRFLFLDLFTCNDVIVLVDTCHIDYKLNDNHQRDLFFDQTFFYLSSLHTCPTIIILLENKSFLSTFLFIKIKSIFYLRMIITFDIGKIDSFFRQWNKTRIGIGSTSMRKKAKKYKCRYDQCIECSV